MSIDPPGLPSWPRTSDREADREANGWNTSSADDEIPPGVPPEPEKPEVPAAGPTLSDVSTARPPVIETSEGASAEQSQPTTSVPAQPAPAPPAPAVEGAPAEHAAPGDTQPVPAAPVVGARRRPQTPPPRRRRKARRVHRVVHHFDIWSVARVSGAFAVCGYFVTLITGVLLWQMARRVGTLEGIEGFMEDTGGYDTFHLQGDIVFQVAAFAGVLLAILLVCLAVLGAILFNLISDLTGGIRMTVIDEDLIVTPARRPRRSEPGARSGPEPG